MVFNRTEYDAALAIVKASLDQPALKGLFQPELVDPRNMTIYPWDMIAIFAALVGVARFLEYVLGRASVRYQEMELRQQRIVVTYILELLVMTVSIILAFAGGADVLSEKGDITLDNYRLLSVALWLICLVYIWELTYRMDVGLPLFVHHMSILLMCQLIILTLYDTTTVFYARLATIISLHANSDQMTFGALLFYRFAVKNSQIVFLVAAAQCFLLRQVLFVYVWFIFADLVNCDECTGRWHGFWLAAWPILNISLYLAQIYGMYVLVVLAIKSRIADDGHSQNNLAIGQFNDPGSAPMHDMRHGRQSSAAEPSIPAFRDVARARGLEQQISQMY